MYDVSVELVESPASLVEEESKLSVCSMMCLNT